MASQKRSVNLSDEAVGFAEQYSRDIGATEVRWSGAVNHAIHRIIHEHDQNIVNAQKAQELDMILRSHVPELSESDWQEIFNIQNGAFIELRPSFRLASDMMDYYGAVSVESLSPAQADLAKRLHAMLQIQQAAILWVCRNFWSQPRDFGTLMDMVQAAIRGE